MDACAKLIASVSFRRSTTPSTSSPKMQLERSFPTLVPRRSTTYVPLCIIPLSLLTSFLSQVDLFVSVSFPFDVLRVHQFFLKGTSLAQLAEEYDLVKVNIATIHTALQQKELVLPEMKQTVRDAEKKVLAVEAGAQLEQTLIKVEGEAAWRMVINKEKVRYRLDRVRVMVEGREGEERRG